MTNNDNDDNQGVVWAILIGVILLAISLAVGMGLYRTSKAAGGADGAVSTSAAVGAPVGAAPGSPAEMTNAADVPSIRVENGVVKFYFATGSAALANGAADALGDVVKGVAAGRKAAQNEELAKQRAFAVRDALAALGIGEDKVDLRKPEAITATGSNAEARRVEVTLQ